MSNYDKCLDITASVLFWGGNDNSGMQTPSRRRFLRDTLAVGTCGSLAGCAGGKPEPTGFAEGFEDGFDWETDADVPDDPNATGPVAWDIARTTERASSGDASLRYFLDGRQDDGTIWATRSLSVERDTAYEVEMAVDAWSASESFNTLAHLVLYGGRHPPDDEGSFPEPNTKKTSGATGGLREPLNRAEGWDSYSVTWQSAPVDTGAIHVAVGISAVWETEMTYFVDDVEVTATPV